MKNKYSVKVYVEMTFTRTVQAYNENQAEEMVKKKLCGKLVRLKRAHLIDQSTIYKLAK
jgi:hypothetical protein